MRTSFVRRSTLPLVLSLAAVTSVAFATGCDSRDPNSNEMAAYDDPAGEPAAAPVAPEDVPEATPETIVHDGAQAIPVGEPAPNASTWTLVQSTDGPTSLLDFERGVVADVAGQHYRVENGRLEKFAAARPDGSKRFPWEPDQRVVEGTFPADAWTAEISHYDRAGSSIVLRKFVERDDSEKSGWVAQRMKAPKVGYFETENRGRELAADDAFMLRKASLGGYLIAGFDDEKIGFARIGGGRGAPKSIDIPKAFWDADAYPVDFFEDGTGKIHVLGFSYEHSHPLILSSKRCRKGESPCEPQLTELKSSKQGNFGQIVSRARDSFTATLNDGWEDHTFASHLVHNDGGKWSMERVPEGGHIRHMVAAADGGLWAVVEAKARAKSKDEGEGDAQLWHRNRDGAWEKIELPGLVVPEGRNGLDIAMDDDDQLWLAVNGGGRHGLFTADGIREAVA